MSFNWTEYLFLAQELTSKSTTSPIQEAHLRCAISRAYYAAFCKARNLLLNKDGYSTPRGTNVHWDVVDKFENSSDTTRQYIGTLLRNLRSIRNIVDYKDTFHGNLLGRTQAVLIEAEEVIRLIGTL
jgi:uncharacterized protein (UPF0332 family)